MPQFVNDVVSRWGTINTGVRDYAPSELSLLAGRTQGAFTAEYPGLFYNEALVQDAAVTDNISLNGDNIVLGLDNVVLTY